MKRYGLALDLVDNPVLISEYEQYHQAVWPEIIQSIKDSGITNMEIYRLGNRVFMIMDTTDLFSFEAKSTMDKGSARVQEWEQLMGKYQQALPQAKPGEKWQLMDKIFQL